MNKKKIKILNQLKTKQKQNTISVKILLLVKDMLPIGIIPVFYVTKNMKDENMVVRRKKRKNLNKIRKKKERRYITYFLVILC